MRYTIRLGIEPILSMNESRYYKVYRDIMEALEDTSKYGATICPYTMCHSNYGLGHLTTGSSNVLLGIF